MSRSPPFARAQISPQPPSALRTLLHRIDAGGNNFPLASLPFVVGWRNSLPHFPGTARQGLRGWQIDRTGYGLERLAALGLIKGCKSLPGRALAAGRR